MHDFDADNVKRYNPTDYGLPVWKDEDHQPKEEEPQKTGSVIEDYINRAIAIANDNRHGYSQQNRWGPDYDCSSMVIQCLQDAGIPAKDRGATFTGNMREVLSDCGFKNVISTCNCVTAEGMKRGDILLNDANHTAIYLGNGQLVHARSSEGNSIQGDQSGNEIRVQPYYNYPWTAALRYAGDRPTEDTSPIDTDNVTTSKDRFYELRFPYLQNGDTGDSVWVVQTLLQARNIYCGPWGADGDFGGGTEKAVKDFQRRYNLAVDGIVGPETGASLFVGEIVKETNNFGLGAQLAQKIREGE